VESDGKSFRETVRTLPRMPGQGCRLFALGRFECQNRWLVTHIILVFLIAQKVDEYHTKYVNHTTMLQLYRSLY
jgi:hypothetical protein